MSPTPPDKATAAAPGRFGRNAATVGLATAVSRLLGFARDILVANALGAGGAAEAFVVAFRIPGLLRRLLVEGAFNTAFVPLYGQSARAGQAELFTGSVFTLIVSGFVALTLAALAAMPAVVALIAPGIDGETARLATELSRLTFPYCLATAAMVVASALLNVHGRFVASAYAPALVNVAAILALTAAPRLGWIGEEGAARALAASVLAGGIAQCALVFLALHRAGIALRPMRPRLVPPVRRFFALVLPGVVAAGITQVNAVVALVIASPQPGAVAWLYYADRIYQLPLGMIGVAIGVALLPALAQGGAEGEARHAFSRAAEFAAFLGLPAAVALAIAGGPIVAVLFERGAFTAQDSAATATALRLYALGLPAFVGARLVQPLFFARTRMRLPFLVALLGVVADVGLSLALFPAFGHAGIAAAAAASAWLNLALLGLWAWRAGWLAVDADARRRLPRLALASLVMGAALAWAAPAADLFAHAGTPGWQRILALGLLCLGGLALHLAACLALGGLDRAALRRLARGTKADPPPALDNR